MDVTQFMPHGMCFLWKPDLLAFHIAADALIALAYFSIPVFLIWRTRSAGCIKRDVENVGTQRMHDLVHVS